MLLLKKRETVGFTEEGEERERKRTVEEGKRGRRKREWGLSQWEFFFSAKKIWDVRFFLVIFSAV